MIPKRWPLRIYDETRHQFDIIKRILCDQNTDEIVCATDAGREGELIFRFIYEAAGSTKPVRRLWISSLTDEAIRTGFADLRPAREFDGLADPSRIDKPFRNNAEGNMKPALVDRATVKNKLIVLIEFLSMVGEKNQNTIAQYFPLVQSFDYLIH